jgi:outer membrane lipoprotein-sorting protein
MLAPLVLLLVLPGADPNEAEQLFRQMEAKVTKVKTLECTYDTKVEADQKGTIKGKLFLTEGNKSWLEMGAEFGGKSHKMTVISDGTKMKFVREDGKSPPVKDVPKWMGEAMRVTFTRAGVTYPYMSTRETDEKEFKADEHLRLADFKLGKKEMIDKQEAQAVQYTLTAKKLQVEVKIDVTVWIDTKTQLPLKRVLSVVMGEEKLTLTETYTNIKLDGKIDPKQFELPKE